MSDSNHPIWALLRIIVVSIALTITLWANASHFDQTELWTIGVIFFVLSGNETALYLISHLKPKANQNND